MKGSNKAFEACRRNTVRSGPSLAYDNLYVSPNYPKNLGNM